MLDQRTSEQPLLREAARSPPPEHEYTPHVPVAADAATRQHFAADAPTRRRKRKFPTLTRLWLALLLVVIVIMLGSTAVYMACEKWSFLQALFFSVSIGYSVGMVPTDSNGTSITVFSDVAIIYTCVHAMLGGLIIAAAAALLVQQVLMRDDKIVRKEYERVTKEAEFRTAQTTEHGRPTAQSNGRPTARSDGRPPLNNPLLSNPPPLLTPQRGAWEGLRRWHLVVMMWWLFALLAGYLYGLLGEIPGRAAHKASPHPFALLWAVSSLTGLGAVAPNDSEGGLLFATFFVIIGVPLNAAFLAMIVDLYLSYVQRREARRKVLANPLGRSTFFDLAHTRSTQGSQMMSASQNGGVASEWPRVVTWPVYLEHKLRELSGTTLSSSLLDTIHESFLQLGGRKGYLMLDDLAGEDSAEAIALAGAAQGGGASGGGSGGGGHSLSGSFCDGGPLTPNSRARSWHGQFAAEPSLPSSPLGGGGGGAAAVATPPRLHMEEASTSIIVDSPERHV